jgi:hypothetical protein
MGDARTFHRPVASRKGPNVRPGGPSPALTARPCRREPHGRRKLSETPADRNDIATIRAAVDRLFLVQAGGQAALSIMDALASLRWMLGDSEIDREVVVALIRERAAELERRLVP